MKNLIKQILREEITNKVIEKVLSRLGENKIKPPFFKNLDMIGLTEEEIQNILETYLQGRYIDGEFYDKNGNLLYSEWGDGRWAMYTHNEMGLLTSLEDFEGYWENREYDHNGNETYRENSKGEWYRNEYDDNGRTTYFENNKGFWVRQEYDQDGKIVSMVNSRGEKYGRD